MLVRTKAMLLSISGNHTWAEDILLECARSVVAANLLVEALSIMARKTSGTATADPTEPLDSHAIADFDGAGLCSGSHLHDLANALVAADLAWLSWVGELLPAVGHDA